MLFVVLLFSDFNTLRDRALVTREVLELQESPNTCGRRHRYNTQMLEERKNSRNDSS